MKLKIIILFTLLFIPASVQAQQGCCSYHGGISHCGNNGYYICNDGTTSPSCSCYSTELNESHTLTFDEYDPCYSKEKELEQIRNENAELKDKNQSLSNQISNYETIGMFGIIGFIIFLIYKASK